MKLDYKGIFALFILFLLLCSVRLGWFLLPDSLPERLSQTQINQELYLVKRWLENESAFFHILPKAQQAEIEKQLRLTGTRATGQSLSTYRDRLSLLLAPLGDPAANVTSDSPSRFSLQLYPENGRWLATRDDALLDPRHPFITHIDGLPLTRFLKQASKHLPASLGQDPDVLPPLLSQLQSLRQQLGLDISRPPRLTLVDELADSRRTYWLSEHNGGLSFAKAPANRLSYLADNAALLVVADLDNLSRDMLTQAMKRDALILDISGARHGNPEPLTPLLTKLADGRELPGLTARYRPFGAHKHHQLEQLGLRQTGNSHEQQGLSPLFSGQFKPERASGTASAFSSVVVIVDSGCSRACAQLAYLARHLPNVTLAGTRFAGDFSPRTQLRLPHSGITLSASTSLFYDDQGNKLSGLAINPDISLARYQTMDWHTLTALLSQGTQQQLTADINSQP
ncbi:S41 family peptidase [Shewanella submarina]|uniref:S41 family peptidase n=1 Tax=Shewanella submarina TaxID=2016376 RepID=A0ABV7GJF6_9GAMM|nr:S41 family peptidase [Shewanella submarina]MCL1036092.1 S41 family peptidase [Shewanella submarina]